MARAERAPSRIPPIGTRAPPGRGRQPAQSESLSGLDPGAWAVVLKGWRETPSHGLALLAGFYGTMVLALAGIIMVFALVRSAGRAVSRILLAASVGALTCWGFSDPCRGAGACSRLIRRPCPVPVTGRVPPERPDSGPGFREGPDPRAREEGEERRQKDAAPSP